MLDVDIEKILPITEVKQNLEKIVTDVEGNDDLFVITQNGKPAAVIVGVKHLEVLTGMSHEDLMIGAGGSAAAAAATGSNSSQQGNSAFINYGANQSNQAQASTDDSTQTSPVSDSNSQVADDNTSSPFEYPSSLSDQLKNLQPGDRPQTTATENNEAPASQTDANTPVMTPPLEMPATPRPEEQPAVVTSPLEEPIIESEIKNPVEPIHPLSGTEEETPAATPASGQAADISTALGTPAANTNTLQPDINPAQNQNSQSSDQPAAIPAGQTSQEPGFGADANQTPDLNNLSSAQLNNLDTSGQQLKTPQQGQQQ